MREEVTNPKELVWNQAVIKGIMGARVVIDEEKKSVNFFIGVPATNKEGENKVIWHDIISYNEKDIEAVKSVRPDDVIEVTGKLVTRESAWDKSKMVQIILPKEHSSLQVMTSLKETVPSATITLIGNVGSEPKLFTEENKAFASVNLGSNDKWVDPKTNETKQHCHWSNVIVAGLKGSIFASDHLQKGTCIQVSGALSYEQWKDKSGIEHSKPRIVVHAREQLKILDFKEPARDQALSQER
jgi:single-stranded DNA-binding protein